LSEARKKPWKKFVNESSFEILLASFLQYTIKLLRHIGRHITASLLFLALFCTTIAAQDSTRRATPTPAAAPATSPGASVNNPSLTVPPIITPLEQPEPRKPRRRRLTAADSVRIAAQRDSIARLAQMAQTATLTPQTTPNATPATVGAVTPNIATPITAALSAPEVPVLDSSSNPFDILRGTKASADSASLAAKQNADNLLATAPSLLNKQTYSKNFLFWIFLMTLILMAFVVSNARVAVQNAYQALLSGNALRQIHRDQVWLVLAQHGYFCFPHVLSLRGSIAVWSIRYFPIVCRWRKCRFFNQTHDSIYCRQRFSNRKRSQIIQLYNPYGGHFPQLSFVANQYFHCLLARIT
jgi:hypothetical protein